LVTKFRPSTLLTARIFELEYSGQVVVPNVGQSALRLCRRTLPPRHRA
jgi:hypothetical protein